MNREVAGKNDQHVTRWGRDLEGDTYVGSFTDLSTTTTCRCGSTHKVSSHPSAASLWEAGWVLGEEKDPSQEKEWFCSLSCYKKYHPEGVAHEVEHLTKLIKVLEAKVAALV